MEQGSLEKSVTILASLAQVWQLCQGRLGQIWYSFSKDQSSVRCQAGCHILGGASSTPGSSGSRQTQNVDVELNGRGTQPRG